MRANRSRTARGVVALGAAGAFLCWSFMNALGVFGAPTVPQTGAAATAYQYGPSYVNVTGSGTIDTSSGSLNFSISAKFDTGTTTGSCSINEPKTKTKIKCLDVTSIDFVDLGGGRTRAIIKGTATVNGASTPYVIQVEDAGSPGVGADSFAIDADGVHRSGVLTSGNLTIHFTP